MATPSSSTDGCVSPDADGDPAFFDRPVFFGSGTAIPACIRGSTTSSNASRCLGSQSRNSRVCLPSTATVLVTMDSSPSGAVTSQSGQSQPTVTCTKRAMVMVLLVQSCVVDGRWLMVDEYCVLS